MRKAIVLLLLMAALGAYFYDQLSAPDESLIFDREQVEAQARRILPSLKPPPGYQGVVAGELKAGQFAVLAPDREHLASERIIVATLGLGAQEKGVRKEIDQLLKLPERNEQGREPARLAGHPFEKLTYPDATELKAVLRGPVYLSVLAPNPEQVVLSAIAPTRRPAPTRSAEAPPRPREADRN